MPVGSSPCSQFRESAWFACTVAACAHMATNTASFDKSLCTPGLSLVLYTVLPSIMLLLSQIYVDVLCAKCCAKACSDICGCALCQGLCSQTCRTRSIRMDYAFSGGGATCRDFWQASGPEQTQPPVTAWRQAFRKTVESGIQLSEVSAEVASISVACNDPAPEFFTNLRRVSLTVQLAPDLTIKDYAQVSGRLCIKCPGRCVPRCPAIVQSGPVIVACH